MGATPATSPVESRRRYPGTGPFGPEDAALFFGRKRETEELYLRTLSVPLLLQFGKSGLGKTSLLQAGLFPLLRAKPFLPVMIRLNDPRESLTDAVARSIRESVVNEGVDIGDTSAGLWELLATTIAWREDLLLTPVLAFDQFEEVFTLWDQRFRTELAGELGRLATGIPPERLRGAPLERPEVKLLISLKETHLGALEQFSARIPRLFQERLRLEPLSASDAADAVVNPAQLDEKEGEAPYWTKPFTYDDYALDAMLTYLKGTLRRHRAVPASVALPACRGDRAAEGIDAKQPRHAHHERFQGERRIRRRAREFLSQRSLADLLAGGAQTGRGVVRGRSARIVRTAAHAREEADPQRL